MSEPTNTAAPRRGILDWIERVGNALPEPALLFALLAVIVVVLSGIGSAMGWQVQPVQPRIVMVDGVNAKGEPVKTPKLDANGKPEVELVKTGEPISPKSLLTGEGVYWMLSSMLRNFTGLPALGLIFVAMLGIGLAEKFGFFGALMRALAMATPAKLLTPMIVFLGANSSVASDAGYIILPPLAAALYMAVGRPPIAGLAAAFAGVAGGFGAGFFPTGGDGVLAGFAQDAARVIDPNITVTIVHNLYFKSGSVLIIMLAGWWVTDRVVEPRLRKAGLTAALEGPTAADLALKPDESRALRWSIVGAAGVLALFAAMIFIPGAPLHGVGQPTLADGRVLIQHAVTILPEGSEIAVSANDVLAREPLVVKEALGTARMVETPGDRWSHVIVPMIFLLFLVPGLIYGRLTGVCRTQKDVIEGFYHGIRGIVPVLAIAFFMAQFINYFAYTKLDRMIAYAGGIAPRHRRPPRAAPDRTLRPPRRLRGLRDLRDAQQIRRARPHIHPDVHDGREEPRTDHRRLPHRRLGRQHHYPAELLPPHHPRRASEVQERGGPGEPDLSHAPLLDRLRAILDSVPARVVRARIRPRTQITCELRPTDVAVNVQRLTHAKRRQPRPASRGAG
jgi:aminobenzoyl-glutamate transport protein